MRTVMQWVESWAVRLCVRSLLAASCVLLTRQRRSCGIQLCFGGRTRSVVGAGSCRAHLGHCGCLGRRKQSGSPGRRGSQSAALARLTQLAVHALGARPRAKPELWPLLVHPRAKCGRWPCETDTTCSGGLRVSSLLDSPIPWWGRATTHSCSSAQSGVRGAGSAAGKRCAGTGGELCWVRGVAEAGSGAAMLSARSTPSR